MCSVLVINTALTFAMQSCLADFDGWAITSNGVKLLRKKLVPIYDRQSFRQKD